ncbi:GNAT family N-acetyltransferase [Flavipsychrobacter stenotrophus]|uniref:GNAT family N-acetyltransferase n=1 Tax=Flavipsychrobacter stenotrophus TaxID=2077091 RepID=A0A2S7ST15_9BACT|nr:GNAT family N-acetyltransferase [Flavipsychrobacter stenotrophus]PQJ09747.1 GNAT family N-acetyltransferase [Flavipsychrobacter stenotrophus]
MDIQQADNGKKGRFFIEADGHEIAAMHYVYSGEKQFIIDHTEVAEAFEGRGLGKQLLNAVVKFARENNFKIIPLCPYAKAVFEKVPDIRDVLVNP